MVCHLHLNIPWTVSVNLTRTHLDIVCPSHLNTPAHCCSHLNTPGHCLSLSPEHCLSLSPEHTWTLFVSLTYTHTDTDSWTDLDIVTPLGHYLHTCPNYRVLITPLCTGGSLGPKVTILYFHFRPLVLTETPELGLSSCPHAGAAQLRFCSVPQSVYEGWHRSGRLTHTIKATQR